MKMEYLKQQKRLFNDDSFGSKLEWSGGNYASMKKNDAMSIVCSIKNAIVSMDANESITLVGHSHGGNVSIEAINIMAGMKEFKGRNFNLLTINTPVRDDHQLSEDAAKRVTHINVYDPKDPVQERGGNSFRIFPDYKSKAEFTGEFGKAGRTYPSDKVKQNIEVSNPQGFSIFSGEWHNSHNRVDDWFNKIKRRMLWEKDGRY